MLELVATTSLQQEANRKPDASWDSFLAKRYFDVIDNPILYARPNKETFKINDITVSLSLYSPNGTYKAIDLKERMEEMMIAQKAFLGDVDSTKEYNILLYLSQLNENDAQGFGALEHHTSTVGVLPESMSKDRLEQAMIDVVSHEFFHIVTPLSIHSKEIQYFDFNDPKMSQHLWMYEGTTEYFANLFQIQQNLIDEEEFYERIMQKVANAKGYDDAMSFTIMSKNILKEPYETNYANVYEKGALINMALDILIREKSNGQKGILWLMKQLSRKYGKDVPFEDDKLIDEIVDLTYPEVKIFFDNHVFIVIFNTINALIKPKRHPRGVAFNFDICRARIFHYALATPKLLGRRVRARPSDIVSSAKPSTRRVSRGSITPWSRQRPEV